MSSWHHVAFPKQLPEAMQAVGGGQAPATPPKSAQKKLLSRRGRCSSRGAEAGAEEESEEDADEEGEEAWLIRVNAAPQLRTVDVLNNRTLGPELMPVFPLSPTQC